MATKSKSKSPLKAVPLDDLDLDHLNFLDDLEFADLCDPDDQAFWDEYFKIEHLLSASDDLDPPQFAITVQNQSTGETKTYRNIRLKAARTKIEV